MGNDNLRKIWFITRPERDPAFHQEALKALQIATNNFTEKWSGNREIHKKYEQELINLNIKRNSISASGSGGRTWVALLKTFSYCYLNNDGYLVPAKVALEILKGNNVFENIKKQILTLQIPNAYFLDGSFKPKYESGFHIFPIRFILKLCTNPDIDYYLTKEELVFIVMLAKNNDEYNLIIDKIKLYRAMNNIERDEFKENISLSFEHRERKDNVARDFYTAHSDVAHTFMLVSEFTGLVEYIRGKDSKIKCNASLLQNTISELNKFDERYPFNSRYLFSLERMAEVNGLDINSFKATRYHNIKPTTNYQKKLIKVKNILSDFPNANSLTRDELLNILSNSFSVQESEKLIDLFIDNNNIENLDENFINCLLTEENNLEFENKIGRILELLGFNIVMHPKVNGERTEIDILVYYKDNLSGIIDAKNYKEKFNLSSSMASHMASEYIPNYMSYNSCNLSFYGYVTCNNIGGVSNLNKITKKIEKLYDNNILGLLINVQALLSLLDYCIENNLEKDARCELFLKLIDNTSYTSFNDVYKKIQN